MVETKNHFCLCKDVDETREHIMFHVCMDQLGPLDMLQDIFGCSVDSVISIVLFVLDVEKADNKLK